MNSPLQTYPTGSAYIVDRASANDKDIVLLFESKEEAYTYRDRQANSGWTICGIDYGSDQSQFEAIRNGDDNEIIVWDYMLFLRWVAFTETAKALGLSAKVERVELAKALIDGEEQAAYNFVRYAPVYQKMAEISDLYIND